MQEFLSMHKALRGTHVDDTRCLQDSLGLYINLQGPGNGDLKTTFNLAESNGGCFTFFTFDRHVSVNPSAEHPRYWAAVPMLKPAQTGTDKARLGRIPSSISSPTTPAPLVATPDANWIGLGLGQAQIDRFAAKFLDHAPPGAITFHQAFDYRRGADRYVAHSLAAFAQEEAVDPTILSDTAFMDQFWSAILRTLILHRPHSLSHLLTTQPAAPAPRDVRMARDFLQANLHRGVTLSELIELTGVPGRTLQDHFTRFTGASPVAYHRLARLKAARDGLRGGRFHSVTEAAMAHGFHNLGRFARSYKSAFLESPSDTLRHGQ